MSYLDVPRLHFSGLFFVGPNTINNSPANYDPNTPLEDPSGQYASVAGWNPLGVAQWWLEECNVLSAVGSNGAAISSDPVLGAPVLSPSPKTPISDGTGGYYDLAKMVDLDVDQQGRSALYGLRISVTVPGGAGFQGLINTIPELRQLNPRMLNPPNSWGAVGDWMGTVQDVSWFGNISISPFLVALKAAATRGLNVKLTVDLHQRNPANVFTSGDQFCYGRVLGSIGPALPGDFAQVVPGRCLQPFQSPAPLIPPSLEFVDSNSGERLQARERVVARGKALGEAIAANTSATLPTLAWNPAYAIVRPQGSGFLLSIDIGGCIHVNATPPAAPTTSDGTFVVDSGIAVGVFNLTTRQFTPFANGNINISPEYQQLLSTPKNVKLVKNSCVFSFPISTAENSSCKSNPLEIQVNGVTVAREQESGFWIDVATSSQRLECQVTGNPTAQMQIMVQKFGFPVTNQMPPVTATIENGSTGQSSTDVAITFTPLDADGASIVTTTVKANQLNLPPERQPLDSEVIYVVIKDSNGKLIGDEASMSGPAAISVLLWNAFTAPAVPTWNDISQIFGAYARMYPGMKSRLDISNEATVVGDVDSVLGHVNLPVEDPAYMPVTRDLSPSKMNMIIKWLQLIAKS